MNVDIGTVAVQFLFWEYFRYCVFAVLWSKVLDSEKRQGPTSQIRMAF